MAIFIFLFRWTPTCYAYIDADVLDADVLDADGLDADGLDASNSHWKDPR